VIKFYVIKIIVFMEFYQTAQQYGSLLAIIFSILKIADLSKSSVP